MCPNPSITGSSKDLFRLSAVISLFWALCHFLQCQLYTGNFQKPVHENIHRENSLLLCKYATNQLPVSSQHSLPAPTGTRGVCVCYGCVSAVHHTYRLPRKTCFLCISSFGTHIPSRYCVEGKHSVNVHWLEWCMDKWARHIGPVFTHWRGEGKAPPFKNSWLSIYRIYRT